MKQVDPTEFEQKNMHKNHSYIICRTTGGLGNELFQYSAARAIAKKTGGVIRIDSSYFRRPFSPRRRSSYGSTRLRELGVNALELSHWMGLVVGALAHFKKGGQLYNYVLQTLRLAGKFPLIAFDIPSLKVALGTKQQRIIMRGYWQCLPEIADLWADLAEEIDLTPSEMDAKYVKSIGDTFSTGLHIRLGDYVTDRRASNIYARMTKDYYSNAMCKVRNMAGGKPCKFYVFSNDADGARDLLGDDDDLIYVDDIHDDIREFKLLAMCKNQIIANSTFSWWAAWLNSHVDKIVVAPDKWFNDPARQGDVWIPNTWKREAN